ncbi:MAG: hypothetical protein GOVbin3661_34 [Prokaryotic dsDNA virus sp.]|nr:MAG: hypothetical protein GOVbin3661_34 [Prokaryotic dsDNA virus sp.]|tara:strand:- start:324 stop:482 length:159 start_codon:yes stop_codon:yes gene_type:complete
MNDDELIMLAKSIIIMEDLHPNDADLGKSARIIIRKAKRKKPLHNYPGPTKL